jgi:hypothetical protein
MAHSRALIGVQGEQSGAQAAKYERGDTVKVRKVVQCRAERAALRCAALRARVPADAASSALRAFLAVSSAGRAVSRVGPSRMRIGIGAATPSAACGADKGVRDGRIGRRGPAAGVPGQAGLFTRVPAQPGCWSTRQWPPQVKVRGGELEAHAEAELIGLADELGEWLCAAAAAPFDLPTLVVWRGKRTRALSACPSLVMWLSTWCTART